MRKGNELISLGLDQPKKEGAAQKPLDPNAFINSHGALELGIFCFNVILIAYVLCPFADFSSPAAKKPVPFYTLLLLFLYGPFPFRRSISGEMLSFLRCFSSLTALKKGAYSGDLFSITKVFFAAFILIFLMDWHYWPYFFVPTTSIVGVQVVTAIYRSFKKPKEGKGQQPPRKNQ